MRGKGAINLSILLILAIFSLLFLSDTLPRTGKAREFPTGIQNGGSIKVHVFDSDSKKPIRNAEVALYDDSLTEIEAGKTTRKGLMIFNNAPIEFNEDIMALYKEDGKSIPEINKLDSRIYYIDIAAPGYGAHVTSVDFAEGIDSIINVYLFRDSIGLGITAQL
ncbi:hypothetical protein J4401_01090 [Candidatus Woesearchaeota archaeon]|nr:hypothetical protein [Candidatus Woesearchaeota archaeon]